MSKGLIFLGVSLSAGALAVFGIRKYKQVQGLKLLKVTPAAPSLTFKHASNDFVDGSINLLIENPTPYDYHIKKFTASIQSASSKLVLGNFSLPDAKLYAQKSNPISIASTLKVQEVIDLAKNIFLSSSATIFLTGTVIYESSGIEVPYPFSFQVDLQQQLKQLLQ
jgi:hypothetical protein